MQKASHKPKLTVVSSFHYLRLVYRSALFLAFLGMYLSFRLKGGAEISTVLESRPMILSLIWAVFMVEMVLRFFPSRLESPGCQKQFARNYVKTGKTTIDIQDNNAVVLVALIWIAFNGLFGALHMSGFLDDGIMILLCLAYSVCDMICILFFCPFQSWFLKNKCCCTCRIYNWDRWEITFYKYPERFSEATNGYLDCRNCSEKLCAHKNQLRRLWTQIAAFTDQRLRKLR